jgi:hypothetical protein
VWGCLPARERRQQALLARQQGWRGNGGYLAIVSDGFDRTAEKCFFTSCALLFSQRLLVNKRITVFVRAFEVVGRGIAANVAVDAAGVHVIAAGYVFRNPIIPVRQSFLLVNRSVISEGKHACSVTVAGNGASGELYRV